MKLAAELEKIKKELTHEANVTPSKKVRNKRWVKVIQDAVDLIKKKDPDNQTQLEI